MTRYSLVPFIIGVFFASLSHAATFDFLGSGGPDYEDKAVAQTEPRSTVAVQSTAAIDRRIQQQAIARMNFSPWLGLGVIGDGDNGQSGDQQIDSYGSADVVIFTFDQLVHLSSITFTMTDWWDRFDLYVGPDLVFQRTFKVDDFRGADWTSTVQFGEGYQATTFAIGASRYTSCGYDIEYGHGCWTENSAFGISALTTTQIDTPKVPLPASGWLLIGALGWLTALARRYVRPVVAA